MNYNQSEEILKKIEESQKILLNCHRNPDPDSIGSAIALKTVLEKMGKEVDIICPTELDKSVKFLSGYEDIKRVDFESFDFSKYDLFIAVDSSTWDMVTGRSKINKPDLPIITIDHHFTDEPFASIKLVDSEISSTAELLYLVFQDWGVGYGKEVATALLTGIIGDTGVFRHPGVGKETLDIASELVSKGADKDEIVLNIYQTYDMDLISFLKMMLANLKIDQEHKFAWSTVSNKEYKECGEPAQGKVIGANIFLQSIAGTDFGIIMVEIEPNYLVISLRARTNFDVSKIAVDLGGGGHKAASGCSILAPFNEAVEKVLTVARKHAKTS